MYLVHGRFHSCNILLMPNDIEPSCFCWLRFSSYFRGFEHIINMISPNYCIEYFAIVVSFWRIPLIVVPVKYSYILSRLSCFCLLVLVPKGGLSYDFNSIQ